MEPIFNRYTLKEMREIIEENCEFRLEKEDDGIEIDMENETDYVRFVINNEETAEIIGGYIIPKSEESQKLFCSVFSQIDGRLYELIECEFGGEGYFEHFVEIESQSGPDKFDIFLSNLDKNRQKGKISNEEYEQTKKEIQSMRLQNVF